LLTRCRVHEKRDESVRASSGGAPAWRMQVGGNKVHQKRELSVNSLHVAACGSVHATVTRGSLQETPVQKLLALSALGNHAAGTPRRRQSFLGNWVWLSPSPSAAARLRQEQVEPQISDSLPSKGGWSAAGASEPGRQSRKSAKGTRRAACPASGMASFPQAAPHLR